MRRRLLGFVTTIVVLGALGVAAAPAPAADPRIVPRPVRVVEGDSGTTAVRVALRLSGRAPAGASVRFRTRGSSAGRRDFRARTGRLRFRRGSRRAVVVLRVRGDRLEERDERLSLRLSRPRNLRIGRHRAASVTIVDDDTPVVATLADAVVTEPQAVDGAVPHGLAIRLDRPAAREVRVDFQIAGIGTATAADVDLVRGTATFAPGETTKALPGLVRGDDLDELDETATVLLANPVAARLGDPLATLAIRDDPSDLPPSVSIGDATVDETVGAATLPVALSAASGRSVSVVYATRHGTADGADAPGADGTLTFAAGATRASISIPITNDERDEDVQSFTVSLAQPDGVTIADGDAFVAIEDDDDPPTVSIADVTVIEANTAASFGVSLSAPSEKPISVRAHSYDTTAAGSAGCTPGSDYVAVSNLALTFDAGEVSRSLDVVICEDTVDEPNETASVALTSLTNVTPGDTSALLAILDDD